MVAVADLTPSQSLSLLDSLEDGRFRESLDSSLSEIIAKLHEHQSNAGGKAKGVLLIALSMTHDGTHVMIEPQVTLRVPKPIRGTTIYFRTSDNGLSTSHPKQLHLPLLDATAEPDTRPMRIAP